MTGTARAGDDLRNVGGYIVRKQMRGEDQFTSIRNEYARDTAISYRALGIMTFLLSHQNEFRVSLASLAGEPEPRDVVQARAARRKAEAEAARAAGRKPLREQTPPGREGKAAVREAVEELEHSGYLSRRTVRTGAGTYATEWALRDPDPALFLTPPATGSENRTRSENRTTRSFENRTHREDQGRIKDFPEQPQTAHARELEPCVGRSLGRPCDGQGKPWCDFCGAEL